MKQHRIIFPFGLHLKQIECHWLSLCQPIICPQDIQPKTIRMKRIFFPPHLMLACKQIIDPNNFPVVSCQVRKFKKGNKLLELIVGSMYTSLSLTSEWMLAQLERLTEHFQARESWRKHGLPCHAKFRCHRGHSPLIKSTQNHQQFCSSKKFSNAIQREDDTH